VNKVGFSAMHAIIVALMAQRQPVGNVMPKVWAVLDAVYMMGFQPCLGTTMLASKTITLKDLFFPQQVFRAASALAVRVALSFGDALTRHSAVDVLKLSLRRTALKNTAADFTGVIPQLLSTRMGTIDFPDDVRRAADNVLATGHARLDDLTGLPLPCTGSTTVAFFQVGRDRLIRGLGDFLPTDFTMLQFHWGVLLFPESYQGGG